MAEEVPAEEESSGRMWSHVLVEWDAMDPLYQPVSATSRIKYQSIDVSKRYIALGTNTGAIYLFQRESLQYIDMITTDKEGAIVQLAFSPDDGVLAYATSKGQVVIVEMRFDRRQKPDRLRQTGDHKGCLITAMKWNSLGNRLYVGDDAGKVSVAKISSTLVKKGDFFKLPSELIMRLDSCVVQLDCYEDRVLASTHTKTYLCFTSKHQFKHIGTKLRDGVYGAGFFQNPDGESCVIYCARPGSRLWEVDEDGTVLKTHQFKLLLDIPSLPVVKPWSDKVNYSADFGVGRGPVSTNFIQLLNTSEYLVSWNDKALFIFNPTEAQVLLWNNQISDILKAAVYKRSIFLLFDNNKIQQLELMPVAKLVSKLFTLRYHALCAKVITAFHSTMIDAKCRRYVPVSMITQLKQELLNETETELASSLDDLLQKIEVLPEDEPMDFAERRNKVSFDKLKSGIYMLRQRTESETYGNEGSTTSAEQSNNNEVSVHNTECVIAESQESEPVETKCKDLLSTPTKSQEEDNQSRDSSNLSRHQSSESLVSSNSLSSNELVFGKPTIDPEPVYAQTKGIRKLKGRKAKVKSVELDETVEPRGRSVKRSQSLSILDQRSPRHRRKHSTVSAEVVLTHADGKDESAVSSEAPKESEIITKTSLGKTQSFTGSIQIIDDRLSTPVVGDSSVPATLGSTPISGGSNQNLAESSMADESRKQEAPSTSSGTPGSLQGSPRFGNFKAVKDRISAKMETVGSTVGSRTRSLFQSLKDKTEQLTIKRSEYVEPADVAENKETTKVEESDSSISPSGTYKFPKVDTGRLEEATQQAKEQLDDPEVQFNSKAVSRILKHWIVCLHETLQTLHTAMLEQKVKELKDSKLKEILQLKEQQNRNNTELETGENASDVIGDVQSSQNRVSDQIHSDEEIETKNVPAEKTEIVQGVETMECEQGIEISHAEIRVIRDLIDTTIHLSDPFQMTSETHSQMAKLALLSFQHNVHENPSRYVVPDSSESGINHEEISRSLEVQKGLHSTCDSGFVEQKECDEITSTGDKVKNDNLSTENSKHQSEEYRILEDDDQELGMFMKCHLHLFRDSTSDVVKVIEKSSHPKDYRWNSLLECLAELSKEDCVSKHISEGNIEVAFDVLRSGPVYERQCMLSHLKRLFVLYPRRTLEFCCEQSNEVSLEFVQFLCTHSEDPSQYFLYYTRQVLMAAPSHTRQDVLAELCCDDDSRMVLIEALLKEGTVKGEADSELHCTCGSPRPRSHKIEWKEREQLDAVLTIKETHTDATLHMCKTYGFWWGYLKILKMTQKESELQRAVIQLSDIDLLEDSQYGLQPCGEKQWESLFCLMNEQCCVGGISSTETTSRQCRYCVYCRTEFSDLGDVSMTFESVAVCLVKQIGPGPALSLLQKVSVPEGHFSCEFLRNCVVAASLESKQRLLVHNILEKLDTYLWSAKPTTIPAQIHGALECEKQRPTDSSTENLFEKLSAESKVKRSVEEQDVHWGTVISLQAFCLACFVSLYDQVASNDQGIVVFRCGHAFHKYCFHGQSCIICTS